MRVIVASFLAVLLIGSSAAAQSPGASVAPAPSVPPVTSAAPSVAPTGTGPALNVTIRNAKACKAGLTCTWYLTVIDPVASTAMVTPLVPGTAKNTLEPTTPLPASLAPGTYLVEAAAWTAGTPTDGSKAPTGRTASCATVLTVPTEPAVTGLDVNVVFKKKQKGCAITSTPQPQLMPSHPGPAESAAPAVSAAPSVAP